jgi:CheY-like chemotaxis protein
VDARTGGIPVLAIEDNEETAFLYSTYLRDTEFRLTHAATEEQARMALQRMPISAIVFDIWLNGAEAWDLLREIKQNPKTRDIPLMIISVMDSSRLSEAKLADAMLVKPADPDEFVTALRDITRSGTSKRVLLVDDNEVSRYVLRQHLANFDLELLEARGGVEAVALAKGSRPDLIILDLLMPDMSGFQVVNELRSSVETSQIPIVVHTSKPLDTGEEQELQARGVHAVLEKSPLTYTAESSKVREILKSMGFSQAARSGGACD